MKNQKGPASFITIGLLKIKTKTNKQNSIKPCFQLRDLKDPNCSINDGKYQGTIAKCFQTSFQAGFESLSLIRNDTQTILLEISHIKFTKLKVLQLATNFIQSIQSLTWLNALHLRVLDLSQNLIASSQSLAKFYTYSISQLKIGQNIFTDLKPLQRMKFRHNQKSRDLSLKNQSFQKPYNNPANNMTFLAKLQQPLNLHQQWINIYAKNRIVNLKLNKAIQRKSKKNRSIILTFKP